MEETTASFKKLNYGLNNEKDIFDVNGIDVIVPVFRVEKYLERCVDSILSQTFQNFKLILIDDGSDDHSPEICDKYELQDSRITAIHQKNAGLSAARNAGIEKALRESKNQWITFVDSDDWIHPAFFGKMLEAVQRDHSKIAACKLFKTSVITFEIPANEDEDKLLESRDYYLNYYENSVPACGKLYCKQLFKGNRYPVDKLHEDEFVTYKLIFAAGMISLVQSPMYYYFFNETGITQSDWNPRRIDALDAVNERLAFFKSRGDKELFSHTAVIYLSYVHLMLKKIDKISNEEKKQEYRILIRQHVSKVLKENRELNVKSYPGLYEIAHPKRMKAYWLIKAVINKTKNFLVCS